MSSLLLSYELLAGGGGTFLLFPIAGAVIVASIATYYYAVLCIKPSRFPRKSSFHDTKHRSLSYPPAYPNGWYEIARCNQVHPGQVLQVEALGKKIAVWRSSSGKLSVLDAFCPHGGANLCGGNVVGDHLQCPFHLWEFKNDGGVSKVPWLDEPPSHIKAKSWTFCEFHGMVCIWFDADGRPPPYQPPRVAQIDDGSLRFCGTWDVDRPIYMHLIEYMENTVDVQHFTPMHGKLALPWTELKIPGITALFDSKVVLGSEDGAEKLGPPNSPHFLYFVNTSSLQFFGKDIPRTTAHVTVQFIGPGSINRFLFTLPDLGQIVMFQTHLPLLENGGLAQRVRYQWFASKAIPKALASYVVGEWVSNWWADVAVWEEKIQKSAPGLVKGDGPIQRGRRWFKQFYSDGSAAASTPQSFDW